MRDIARKLLMGLAWLYVIGTVAQFFLAGLGMLGGESMEAHEVFGYAVLHLYPVLMLLIALVARPPREVLIMALVLAVIVFIQPIWVTAFRGEVLGAMHVVMALVIFGLAQQLAIRATRVVRADATAPVVRSDL
jgi:hypothetical protein